MLNFWFWLAVVMAAADWLVVARGGGRLRWLTKPGALLLMIVWFTTVGAWRGPLLWFGLALVFSMLGDILLLPPRLFLGGLLAFLTAHAFYVVGFNISPLAFSWVALFLLLPVLLPMGLFNQRLLNKMRRGPETRLTIILVVVYSLVIGLMLVSALLTPFRPAWPVGPAWMAVAGALLFVLSDSTLAAARFLRPLRYSELAVIVTYHVGQFLLAGAALWMFA